MRVTSARTVVITGASAGVGRATARAFAVREPGARVALLARGQDGLTGAERDVRDLGGVPLVVPTDVADPDQVEAAAERAEAELGPIDVWVNCAMTGVFAPLRDLTPQEFRRVTEVTYLGYVHGTMSALRRMTERDRGHVVQVGSALAYRGIPLQSAYCGAKHAIQGFTESVRTELLHDRSSVRITSVHLPAMNTPQFRIIRSKMDREAQPVPPLYSPDVAARAIEWASRSRRREVWVGGPTVGTVLGARLAPGLLDHYLGRTGYESQLIDEPRDPARPDNLFAPVPGDHGAHGPYADRAHQRSLQAMLARHRGVGMALAGAALTLGGRAWTDRDSSRARRMR